MEPIFNWYSWKDIFSIYMIPISVTPGGVFWFWFMKKEGLLDEINN